MLLGNPGKRPIRGTVSVPAGMPERPEAMSAAAAAAWDRLGPALVEAGILTPLDHGIFVIYTELWATSRALADAIARDGVVRKAGPHPLLKSYLDVASALRLVSAELGATPAARCRIKVDPPQPKSKVESFREKHGG